ncbi:MAG: lysylphosphatidylglycerol synthase transmembrane domain-containing protein [Lentimicrobiaceae bacterium]|nr:lysylphosphatidylglycerol synthase transmembrane domain-containing protein [Lentimicrobiaceae bacterium]
MKKPWVKTLIKIGGSVAIIWLLIRDVPWDWTEFKRVFVNMHLHWFILSLTGVLLVLGIKSLRWNLLLTYEQIAYPKWNSFVAYMASLTIGLITPGRLGEISRLYYVREETNISFYSGFKTLIVDRIFDFAMLIWFGTTGMMFFYKVLGNIHGSMYLLITAAGMLAIWWVIYLILKKYVHKETSKVGLKFIRESWNGMFHPAMLSPWLLTLLAYFVFYVANYFIFKSIGLHLSLIDIGFILSLMSLATLIPISLAGFGTREVSLVFLLSFYDISPEVAIIFSLLQFSAFFLWGGLIGWMFWLYNPVKMKLMKDDYRSFMHYLKGAKH